MYVPCGWCFGYRAVEDGGDDAPICELCTKKGRRLPVPLWRRIMQVLWPSM